MLRSVLRIPAVGLLLLSLFVFTTQAQADDPFWNNGIGHSGWQFGDPADKKKAVELWDAIGEDLKNEKNELAGTYGRLDYDSGYFLRWSINKGFVVIPYFDQNLITDYGYGTVSFNDSSDIVFNPIKQLRGNGRGLERMHRRWTAIWNFLVPIEQMKSFGQYVAGRGAYNEFNGRCCQFGHGFASRIEGKENQKAYPVPRQFEHFMVKPIEARIIFVGRRFQRDWSYSGTLGAYSLENAVLIPVTLSAGRLQGVKTNMLFRIPAHPRSDEYVHVIRARAQTSDAYVVRTNDNPFPPISKGARVSTRLMQPLELR